MNSENLHNDSDLLRRYFAGEMDELEKNQFEKRAADDPFLSDAMDGFEMSPDVPAESEFRMRPPRKHWRPLLTAGVILCVLAGFALILNQLLPERVKFDDESNQTELKTEIEVIPVSIDTMKEAGNSEQIQVSEIVAYANNFRASEKTEEEKADTIVILDENDSEEELNFALEEEPFGILQNQGAPITFLFDLMVADYREIGRERDEISYTRVEQTGTPAEFENQNTLKTAELIETVVEIPYVDYLRKSMEFFADYAFKKALARYEIILEQYPDDVNALFYGGLCYFNLSQYSKALEQFEKVSDHPLIIFEEESLWYAVKALIKLGKKDEASKLLDTIILKGGFYGPDAIQLKRTLK